jgi:hypothetical protein
MTKTGLLQIATLVSIGLHENTRSQTIVPKTDYDQFSDFDVVRNGAYVGKVVAETGLVVSQKVNRNGDMVQHLKANLTQDVFVGRVMDIRYVGGRGSVIELGAERDMER